jgi:hypothetical protein
MLSPKRTTIYQSTGEFEMNNKYDPYGPEIDFQRWLAKKIRQSFIIVEKDLPNFMLIDKVIENKQHPFRHHKCIPDIHVYPIRVMSMYSPWKHLEQHNLTSPFFIETKKFGDAKVALNQCNEYKYIEDGLREKHKTSLNRKYGDFRIVIADPELIDHPANVLERVIWKSGMGVLYLVPDSERLRIQFNEQDVIQFIPKDLFSDFIRGNLEIEIYQPLYTQIKEAVV